MSDLVSEEAFMIFLVAPNAFFLASAAALVAPISYAAPFLLIGLVHTMSLRDGRLGLALMSALSLNA